MSTSTPRCRWPAGLAALVALVLATACRAVSTPPYPLLFSIDAASPRLLETSQEVAVPVALGNSGVRSWDPGRFHLSYHWLWFVPRELAHRSRTVPYHDGIRTELGGDAPLTPGAHIALQGRILAPATPGLYWLQWDMVEEGVTWFAQVSPRQSRRLVVVVPPPAWIFAPLPLLVALFGLFSLRTTDRRLRIPADVLWCVATLAAKPLILVHTALLEPTAVAYWSIVAVAVVVPALGHLILPQRLRPWVLLVVGIFCSLLILADVVYYRFFGDVLSTPAMLAARQTGHVWGSIGNLFTPGLVWLVADWPIACWLAARLSHRSVAAPSQPSRARVPLVGGVAAVVLVLSGAILSVPRVIASTPLDQMFRARAVVEQLGPFVYHAYDAWNYARSRWFHRPATPAEIDDAAAWLRERAPLRAGAAAFAAARGLNLIVVQVESLQDFAVDFTVGGQEVMPHLRRWTSDSLRFTSVTDQTSEGRTSDAEFTTMTSLLPLDHGAVAFRMPGNHYTALPSVLTEHGYTTLSAVAFEAGFWNRQVMHPAYGFQRSLFEPDFQLTEQIGWGLNDRDFLKQMVPHLEQLPRPFGAWLITLSLHHPFDSFPEQHKVLKLGALEGTSFGNYLHTMRFFDQALADFRDALAHDGLLDSSLIVVFGDHDAGFARDPSLARTIGIGVDNAAWALNDRIPLFIRVGAAGVGWARRAGEAGEAGRAGWARQAAGAGQAGEAGRSGWKGQDLIGARPRPAGQTDFAPTILALLGIDPAPLPYLGRNLLGAADDRPVPRPYGDWLDAKHLFRAGNADTSCYDLASRAIVAPVECAVEDARARRARDLSRLIVIEDLQQQLRTRLAAATPQ
jgi:phosphoglycerol transferase MdoB-like AlkP superfamily enzyme